MEQNNYENIVSNNIYQEAAKGARIYELILDNKDFDCIEDSQIETIEFNDMNFNKFFQYMEKLRAKKDETENKINEFTDSLKAPIKIIINNNFPELNPIIISRNLLRLSGYYYLFKLFKGKDKMVEAEYVKKIDEVVEKFFSDKENYYNILMLLDYVKDMIKILLKEKEDKVDTYQKILFFLDEKMFSNLINSYMNKKVLKYPQYSIQLPLASFTLPDLSQKMKELYNILYILKKTEMFKTNRRFEYFFAFRYNKVLLEQINYVLLQQNMKVLISLDKPTDDITNEAIKYSIDTSVSSKKKDDVISKLVKLLEEEKKKQNDYALQNITLKKEYDKLSQAYEEFNNKCKNIDIERSNHINELENKINTIRQNYIERNTIINKNQEEINSLKIDNQKKEEIIERISYREIGSRIIRFFSLSQSEEKIKEYMEKEISPTNINIIINYIKDNLSNYNKYLKDNQIDLRYILNEIKSEKKGYNSLVHDTKKFKEKYLELMKKKDKNLATKIDFIITHSKLMNRYVFEKDKTITDREIYQEFQDFDNELKKKFQGLKKEEDAKNNIEDF